MQYALINIEIKHTRVPKHKKNQALVNLSDNKRAENQTNQRFLAL